MTSCIVLLPLQLSFLCDIISVNLLILLAKGFIMTFHSSEKFAKSSNNQNLVNDIIKIQNDLTDLEFKQKPSDISKESTDFEDTILSDMAKKINDIQEETNRQIHTLVEENRKASRTSFWLAVSSIVLSAATLIVSFLSLLIQFYPEYASTQILDFFIHLFM